jgi:hypothetical protein
MTTKSSAKTESKTSKKSKAAKPDAEAVAPETKPEVEVLESKTAKAPKTKAPKAPKTPKADKPAKNKKTNSTTAETKEHADHKDHKDQKDHKDGTNATDSAEKKTRRVARVVDYSPEAHCGLNLSTARVRACLDNNVLNPLITKAIAEVRSFRESKDKDGKVVKSARPLAQLSKATALAVKQAKELFVASRRSKYEKDQLTAMTDTARADYYAKRSQVMADAKTAGTVFDLRAFNLSFNKKFYSELDEKTDLPSDTDSKGNKLDEYKRVLSVLGKLKTRISYDCKLYATAFVEATLNTFLHNTIKSCVDGHSKKTVGMAHTEGADSLIRSLSAYSHWCALDAQQKEQISQGRKNKAEKTDKDADSEASSDLVVDDDDQRKFAFKIYVEKMFAYCKSEFFNKTDKYVGVSLSRNLRCFCSDAIVELLSRFGTMIREETGKGSVKTVSRDMVIRIAHHIYVAHGLDFTATRSFMETAVPRFRAFSKQSGEEQDHEQESESEN